MRIPGGGPGSDGIFSGFGRDHFFAKTVTFLIMPRFAHPSPAGGSMFRGTDQHH
jgi:hypothetical protein